jgi:hypothetical protein
MLNIYARTFMIATMSERPDYTREHRGPRRAGYRGGWLGTWRRIAGPGA